MVFVSITPKYLEVPFLQAFWFFIDIEQVLAATPHKEPTIRPPASHHENYPS